VQGGRVGSGGDVDLAGTATRTLAGDDDAGHDQLAAPDAPGLPALEGAGEARLRRGQGTQRALAASTSAGDSANQRSGSVVQQGRTAVSVSVRSDVESVVTSVGSAAVSTVVDLCGAGLVGLLEWVGPVGQAERTGAWKSTKAADP
jgi:hypothetical protein